MPTALRLTAVRAAAGVFVLVQVALASLAATGSHRHAWEPPSADAACWICLVISVASIASVLAAAWSFSPADPRYGR